MKLAKAIAKKYLIFKTDGFLANRRSTNLINKNPITAPPIKKWKILSSARIESNNPIESVVVSSTMPKLAKPQK